VPFNFIILGWIRTGQKRNKLRGGSRVAQLSVAKRDHQERLALTAATKTFGYLAKWLRRKSPPKAGRQLAEQIQKDVRKDVFLNLFYKY